MGGRAHNLLIFRGVATTKVFDCLGSPRLEEYPKGPGDNFPKCTKCPTTKVLDSLGRHGLGEISQDLRWQDVPRHESLGNPQIHHKYGCSLGTQLIRLGTLLWDDFDVGHV